MEYLEQASIIKAFLRKHFPPQRRKRMIGNSLIGRYVNRIDVCCLSSSANQSDVFAHRQTTRAMTMPSLEVWLNPVFGVQFGKGEILSPPPPSSPSCRTIPSNPIDFFLYSLAVCETSC